MPISGPFLSRPAPLHELLTEPARTKPDEIAVISGEARWSWAQLERDVQRMAAHFVADGLRPGDRLATLVPNCGALLVVYLACLKAGGVVTPLNYRYRPAGLNTALELSGARMMFAHGDRADDLAATRAVRDLDLGVLSVGGEIAGARRYEDLQAQAPPNGLLPEINPDDTALLFFTSGSTGTPKGVMHSITSFGSIVSSFAQARELDARDVVFPGGSISHVGSLGAALAALSVQASVVLTQGFATETVARALRTAHPTLIVALPAALIALMHGGGLSRADFASVRTVISGGDAFPVELAQAFREFSGVQVTETYGLTEATGALLGPMDGSGKPGSVGHVCPGFTASIRDDQGQESAQGVLWLSGAPVCQGYWNNPDETQACFVDGWFNTGDLMEVDADGFFWFHGRRKQIIVHDGSNIAPQEVEEAVMHHPAVSLAGAVGVENALHGENVWAFVTLDPEVPRPPVQEIIDTARGQIGYKAPEMVVVLEEMPLNVTGKVDRVALKRMAEAHLQTPSN